MLEWKVCKCNNNVALFSFKSTAWKDKVFQHQNLPVVMNIERLSFHLLHRSESKWKRKTRFQMISWCAIYLLTSRPFKHLSLCCSAAVLECHLTTTFLPPIYKSIPADLVAPLATKSLMLEFCLAHPNSIRMLFPEGHMVTMQFTSTHTDGQMVFRKKQWCSINQQTHWIFIGQQRWWVPTDTRLSLNI